MRCVAVGRDGSLIMDRTRRIGDRRVHFDGELLTIDSVTYERRVSSFASAWTVIGDSTVVVAERGTVTFCGESSCKVVTLDAPVDGIICPVTADQVAVAFGSKIYVVSADEIRSCVHAPNKTLVDMQAVDEDRLRVLHTSGLFDVSLKSSLRLPQVPLEIAELIASKVHAITRVTPLDIHRTLLRCSFIGCTESGTTIVNTNLFNGAHMVWDVDKYGKHKKR